MDSTNAEAPYILAEDSEDISSLIADAHREDRPQAIVIVTSREDGPAEPAIDGFEIRRIVGPRVPIWFVPFELIVELADGLPAQLGVPPGTVRILAPGLSSDSSRDDHPLVDPRRGGAGRAVQRMRAAWRRVSTDHERLPTWVKQELRSLEASRLRALEQAADLGRRLDDNQRRLDSEQRRRIAAERRSHELERELERVDSAPDPEIAFHQLMVREWGIALTRDERREWPLASIILGRQFLADLDNLAKPGPARVAWVCAMVACGRANDLDGLQLHRMRRSDGGGDRPRMRRDGAVAWRCALERDTAGAPRLHYWALRGGAIELANVGHHDRLVITE